MQKHIPQKGFTLVELMVVIAIIGIMAGVVTVNMKGSVDKSKRASALTTASSVLPELVTCADDGGVAPSSPSEDSDDNSNKICCDDESCGSFVSGHSATWPSISSKTGFSYGSTDGALEDGDYVFCLTKSGEDPIKCSLAGNGCDNATSCP